MTKLYIIGNGFDLHHNLPTSYIGFRKYLESHAPTLLSELEKVIFYSPDDKDIWSNFEENLAYIDMDFLDESICEYIPSPSSDDYFKDIDYCYRLAEDMVSNLTENLRKVFSRYICEANSCAIEKDTLINVTTDSKFISFNYTKTLETQYGISSSNILYIHGTFESDENIILGHAVEPDLCFEEKQEATMPTGLSTYEQEQWYDYMSDQYVPFLEEARQKLVSYYIKSFKNSAEIIVENNDFFSSLKGIRHIYILGHSMSEVDIDYFERIKSCTSCNCRWIVSYYSESEKEILKKTLIGLGLNEEGFKLIKLNDLLKNKLS